MNPKDQRELPVACVNPSTLKRKMAYATKARALQQAARLRKEGLDQRAYKCPHCRKWHLTKQEHRGQT